MGDLYARIYTLPDRMRRVRNKIWKLKQRREFSPNKTLDAYDRRALEAAERKLRNLENEARQYHMFDLLKIG